ncbi:unnamed protein product [Trichobilharzia szidati]|nr:unnamed protein product [Trichobilharzia szidati]
MEQIIQLESPNEYRLLGPIVKLPAALEILQTSSFDSRVMTAFTVGSSNRTLKMLTEDVLEELKSCICTNRFRLPATVSRGSVYTWWESVFTQHMLAIFNRVNVVNTNRESDRLDQLAKFGIRIKGFSHIVQEIINNLRPENLNKASRVAQQLLDNDIRHIYENFANSMLSESAIKLHRTKKPVSVLKHLAQCATQLHTELQDWAKEKNLVWPEGHLDSLLVFGQYMERIAATGPFRTLIHLLILIFNTESMDIKKLLTNVISSVRKSDRVLQSSSTVGNETTELIDLTTNSDSEQDEFSEITTEIDDTIANKYPKLTEIVNRFNQLLSQEVENHEQPSQSLWLSLASLEREVLQPLEGENYNTTTSNSSHSRSLLSYLAEAINEDESSVIPLPLSMATSFKQEKSHDSEKVDTSPEEFSSTSEDMDPSLVFDFIQKLTCISSRSKEELCKLVCDNLNIVHSSKLDQFIDSILSQLTDSNEVNRMKPLVYHHSVNLPGILSIEEIQQSIGSKASDIVSRLLTQRECVLNFLSACPSLMDLEVWSQWYQDGLFYDRWGSLDTFLVEAGSDQVCGQFNLIAIRILPIGGGPLLRLTAHPSMNDLTDALVNWQFNHASYTIRSIGDYLIGTAIRINQLTIEQVCSTLKNQFINNKNRDGANDAWIYFVYSLLMNLPFSLFGLVFSSIIIPSLELAGIRSSTSWPLDIPDITLKNSSVSYSFLHILFHDDDDGDNAILPLYKCLNDNNNNNSTDSQPNRNYLISAIGSIGYQLKWPVYIKFFEENRFKPIDNNDNNKMHNIETSSQPVTITVYPSPMQQTESISQKETVDNSNNNATDRESCLKLTEMNKENSSDITDAVHNCSDMDISMPAVETSSEHVGQHTVIVANDSEDTTSNRYQFIEEIRRREFGLGVELSQEASDLVQRVEGKLSRSLVQLSEELYGLPGHFLLELIQNADDNSYTGDEMPPTLEFHLSNIQKPLASNDNNNNNACKTSCLLVMNNEAIGFSEYDMSALCDVGLSTKVTQRELKIGRKGIGFKSVFNVTNAPEIHSNGFHVRFHRQSKVNQSNTTTTTAGQAPSLILIPEWCENFASSSQENSPVPSWCKTLFVLPLTFDNNNHHRLIGQSSTLQMIQLVQTTLHPSLMLFLRRLQCLTFSSEEPNIYWSLKRTTSTLSTFMSGKIKCFAEVITVEETQRNTSSSVDNTATTTTTNSKVLLHKWFAFRQLIPVDIKDMRKNLPSQTEISVAISLSDSEPLPTCPIFSYLPVRSVGFRFYINADFDLTSSREDVDSTSAWNRWLVGKIPNVFSDMIQCIEKLPPSCFKQNVSDNQQSESPESNSQLGYTRIELIARIISCLPYDLLSSSSSTLTLTTGASSRSTTTAATSTITNDNVFFGLPSQLRCKLSTIPWLPGIRRTDQSVADNEKLEYVTASRLLVLPATSSSSSSYSRLDKENKQPKGNIEAVNSSCNPDILLIRLLVNCLQMFEPHEDLFMHRKVYKRNKTSTTTVDNDDINTVGDDIVVVHDNDNEDDDSDVDNSMDDKWQSNYHLINRIRVESLNWLGTQSLSITSLLDLATILKPEDVNRPGLLSVLISSFEACLSAHNTSTSSSSSSSSGALSKPSAMVARRRLLTALQHLPIFPLTNEQCIRLNDKQAHSWADIHPAVLLPPHPSELNSVLIGITYDEYISMLEKLGPLIKPIAFHSSLQVDNNAKSQYNMPKEFSSLLTNESPMGLGLQIATPSIVLKEWIMPYLKKLNQVGFINQNSESIINWCLTIGQFYATIDINFNNALNTGNKSLHNYEFSTLLPIIVSDNHGKDCLLPALCNESGYRRVEPVFLPPASFTIATSSSSMVTSSSASGQNQKNFIEELEVDLFKFLMDQMNTITDSSCCSSVYTVSSKYFHHGFSSHDLRQGCRWFNLFSGAGVCTLLSVHKVKYVYQPSATNITTIATTNNDAKSSNLPKDTIHLPKNHRLQNVIIEALNKEGLTPSVINDSLKNTNNNNNTKSTACWLIEDYVSPGLELLLHCIARLQDKMIGKGMADRLSCLLHDNWSSYDDVCSAYYTRMQIDSYCQTTNEDLASNRFLTKSSNLPNTKDTLHYLSYSSWLCKLRETAWLPVEQQQQQQTKPDGGKDNDNASIQLLSPTTSGQLVYSPAAFFQLESQNTSLYQLLKETCYIWSPGEYIQKTPLDSQFTKAIGLIDRPERSTFEALMKSLGEKAKANPFDMPYLTPDLMLFIYRTAVQYYLREDYSYHYDNSQASDSNSTGKSLNQWLRYVFANPDYPCILVQCPRSIPPIKPVGSKRPRKDHDDNNTNNTINLVSVNSISDYDCPICCSSSCSATNINITKSASTVPGKRLHWSRVGYTPIMDTDTDADGESTPIYHLVDIDMVCWQSVAIDHILNYNDGDAVVVVSEKVRATTVADNTDMDEDDEEEEVSGYADDQCILMLPSTGLSEETTVFPAKPVHRSRVFVLSKSYGSETRQFFVEKLGLPTTSTIDEILSLRPNLPKNAMMKNHMKSMHEFNKRLSHWYALLDYCLREEYFTTQCRLKEDENNNNNNNSGQKKPDEQRRKRTKQPRNLSANTTTSSNIDVELNKSPLMKHIRQFPILLDSFGQWHRPCDVVTLLPSEVTTDSHTLVADKVCLFAWSKPMYAKMIHEEIVSKKLNENSANNDDGSRNTSFGVLAQSLQCLHSRYTTANHPTRPHLSSGSSTFSTSLLLDQFTSSSSSSTLSSSLQSSTAAALSSSRQYHNEGTAHSLLLDLLGLPIIDHTGDLIIKHHGDKSCIITEPQSDSFMIPCRSLDMFLKGFMRLILLWCNSTQSFSNNSNNNTSHSSNSSSTATRQYISNSTTATAIDQEAIRSIIESKEINAFLVDHLHISITFNTSKTNGIANFNRLPYISKRLITALLNGKLFLDSTFGAQIFANLSQIPPENSIQLIYLLFACMNDPILYNKNTTKMSNISSNGITENSMLSQIIEFICPYGGQNKVNLIQFIQGFINLALSIQPDPIIMISEGINSTFLNQLENYLVSHGVKQMRARRELRLLCPPQSLVPPAPVPLQQQEPTVSMHQNESDVTIVNTNSLSVNQNITDRLTSFDQATTKSSMSYTSQSTRYDTTITALQAAAAPFLRLSKETVQTIDSTSSPLSKYWSQENTNLPEYLKTRLQRILSNPTDRLTNIGRLGEMYIYQTLLDYIRRGENRHQTGFDEMASCDFPTGHPLLGVGRLIRCNWCNSENESMRPYDLEVDVQVECDANKWNGLMENLRNELACNIVRVIRSPSSSSSSHQDTKSLPSSSSSRPGVLAIGPIFLEVKSTMAPNSSNSNNNNTTTTTNSEINANSTTDLFEFSLPELLCASQQSWRYHLLRVIWNNDDTTGCSSITSTPKVIHIPDLAGVLKQKSMNLRLCLAMLRSEWMR